MRSPACSLQILIEPHLARSAPVIGRVRQLHRKHAPASWTARKCTVSLLVFVAWRAAPYVRLGDQRDEAERAAWNLGFDCFGGHFFFASFGGRPRFRPRGWPARS